MSSRFVNPFPQFFNSTPTVLSGAQLFFFEAGTSTKLDTYPTYADLVAGTNANDNPVLLNSSGYPASEIFLQAQAYKVVLAPSTDSDPPTSAIWSADNYYGTDFEAHVETKVGSGSPTGSVAGTAGSSGVLPTFYWDYTNSILYVCTTTGDAAGALWTAINASAATPAVPPPQGRLTLVSATPVIASDQASKTAVYYTPYNGNLIPIYNGSTFTPTTFAELTLTLVSSHAADTIYDVFVWSESGTVTIGTGPAWTTSTAGSGARGTGASTTELTRVQGFLVNAVAMTTRNSSTTYSVGANLATYVGSILIDGTEGEVTCHVSVGQSRQWALWNAYNRRPIVLRMTDSTASWTYSTNTIRQSGGDTGNTMAVFTGLAEEPVDIEFQQAITGGTGDAASNTQVAWQIGIGVNSTTAYSGTIGEGGNAVAASSGTTAIIAYTSPHARHTLAPTIGLNDINSLERTTAAVGTSVTITYSGGEDDMMLCAKWMG